MHHPRTTLQDGAAAVPGITISEAARRAGVQRSTLYRKHHAGELSLERAPGGAWRVDLSELLRVYPDADRSERLAPSGAERRTHRKQQEPPEEPPHQKNELMQQLVRRLESEVDGLRRRLDAAEEERRAMLRLLEDWRPRTSWSWPDLRAWWRRVRVGEG